MCKNNERHMEDAGIMLNTHISAQKEILTKMDDRLNKEENITATHKFDIDKLQSTCTKHSEQINKAQNHVKNLFQETMRQAEGKTEQ